MATRKAASTERRTDASNGRKAAGSNQTKQDKRDEHAAAAVFHMKEAKRHLDKATGR